MLGRVLGQLSGLFFCSPEANLNSSDKDFHCHVYVKLCRHRFFGNLKVFKQKKNGNQSCGINQTNPCLRDLFFGIKTAESDGSITMEENEYFDVIELDQGDGWTKVRRENLEEGFVPTSYLEIVFFDK